MNTIETLIAQIKTAKVEIKSLAVAARAAAPLGERMAHGQHAQAVATAQLAGTALAAMPALGYTLAGVSGKTSKTGRSEVSFTYRQSQTLAQRVETVKNAAARRKEKRAAAKAAKDVVPATTPISDAAKALSALDALLNRKAA